MPTYGEMRNIAIERAKLAGFVLGTPIMLGKRSGVVCDVNPFFYDSNPQMVYVDLCASGRFKAKRRELISIAKLSPNLNQEPH